jgi:hypothetical protein
MKGEHTSAEIEALRERPLCAYCAERGIVTRAVMSVSSEGHHNRAIVSLCEDCHFVTKRHIEQHGYRLDIGLDGWPLDPRHLAYGRGR